MKQVNVMGINYEIVQIQPKSVIAIFKESPHYEEVKKLVGDEAQHFAGLCDAQLCKIYINSDLPYEKKKKTLIHEIVEAMDQECILELEHTKMQSITNSLFISGILNVEELLKNEPEDIEISIVNDSAG
jgi:hypothetical protein